MFYLPDPSGSPVNVDNGWIKKRAAFLEKYKKSPDSLIEIVPTGIPRKARIGHFLTNKTIGDITTELTILHYKYPDDFAIFIKALWRNLPLGDKINKILNNDQKKLFEFANRSIESSKRSAILACFTYDDLKKISEQILSRNDIPRPRHPNIVQSDAYRFATYSFGHPGIDKDILIMEGDDKKLNDFKEQLRTEFSKKFGNNNLTHILNYAISLSEKAHANQRRHSNELYVVHPIGCALTAVRVGVTIPEGIIALLLHDTLEDQPWIWNAKDLPRRERELGTLRSIKLNFEEFMKERNIPLKVFSPMDVARITLDLSKYEPDPNGNDSDMFHYEPSLKDKDEVESEYLDRFRKNPVRFEAKLADLFWNTRDTDFSSPIRIRKKNEECIISILPIIYGSLEQLTRPSLTLLFALEKEIMLTEQIADNRSGI